MGRPAQLRQALANVAGVLATEGATLGDVVKTTLFLVDMGDFAAANEVWVEVFARAPACPFGRGVAALPLGRAGGGGGLGLRRRRP